ncbi:hypothetical protein AAG906_016360 [Vitis piasezkii]
MASTDEEKTAFITPHDLYCYKVMPFGLKNVGATYQRLMTKIFKPLVDRIVEVYIDDIVVKSKTREEHALHLQEVFHLLRKYDMKLNPSKCAFSVSVGKFLGFMVNQRGIEVSSDQVKAVMETPPSKSKKELQRLTGKLVALGRFIARFTDELRPFFLAIRKAGASGWTDNCQSAFEKIKHCLMQPPILSSPLPGEKLYMYLAPLCNISQAGPTGRMLQWAIELSEYGIEFQPVVHERPVIADFMLEYSEDLPNTRKHTERVVDFMRVDEASGHRIRSRTLLQSPIGEQLEQAIGLGFPVSNNEAEYEAILSRMDLALALSFSRLRVYSDSQLVVRQVQKEYEAKDECMARYLTKVRDTLQRFTEWTIEKIKRTENGRADALAGIAASLPIKEAILLPIHVQTNPSVVLCPKNPSRHTRPGISRLFHPDRGTYSGPSPISGRSLAHRAHSQGYYWPTMKKMRQLMSKRPLPAAAAQKKFLLVATDYFSKWVEAEAYASIKDKDLTKFVWKNIICRFGIPQTIIADNGPQFDNITFRISATNKTLITALKKRLEQAKGKWVEELPGVLWAYRTTPGRPTGNTPFALAYGRNLADKRDRIHSDGRLSTKATAHYNRKARPRSFKSGTLVLRKIFENTAEAGVGKFQANWEGPYIVSKTSESGAYHLSGNQRSTSRPLAAGIPPPAPSSVRRS